MRRELKRVSPQFRAWIQERERFPAGWMAWSTDKHYTNTAAGHFKMHLTDKEGLFRGTPWCGNPGPENAALTFGLCATHPSQVCGACRAIALEMKLVWDNVLYVKE